MRNLFLVGLLFIAFSGAAQQTPIGSWQTHYANNPAYSIEWIDGQLYMGGIQLFVYNPANQEHSAFSKVNGLNDVNITLIRYSNEQKSGIIVYENSNIDLILDGGFTNIPDIKNFNTTGSKRINSVLFYNKLIYLATDFGIVVLNPTRREVKETYILPFQGTNLEIKGISHREGLFYIATNNGIFSATASSPFLQSITNWTRVSARPMNHILNHLGAIYTADQRRVYQLSDTNCVLKFDCEVPVNRLRSGSTDFYASASDNASRKIIFFNSNGEAYDSTIGNHNARDLVETAANELWCADAWEGLIKLNDRKNKELRTPNQIFTNNCYRVKALNGKMYVAAGAENAWTVTYNRQGYSSYSTAGEWQSFNRFVGTSGLDSVFDILDVAYDKRNKSLFAASYQDGLHELKSDGSHVIYKNNGYIQAQEGNPGAYLIAGLQFDNANNLWMTNYAAPSQLVVKKADGSWQNFSFPYSVAEKSASQLVIDDANQKWIVAPRGIGVYVLNDNNTIDNKNDDKIRKLTTGAGSGNLPNNDVFCITKDKNGKLWIGTSDGIGIINCPESITTQFGCDAELKIVKYDQDAGLLFQREQVKTIAVDGANNKWIGTNNGVWQISDDAEKIMQRFTIDNSPLPTNEIISIEVHPTTGEVFIATALGLVSYRGTATDGAKNNDDLLVFPNPVPSDYNGSIAVRGLVENADVRITDVSGQLVFRTIAQGGQAVWNGKNYLGQKPRSGVYYVFVSDEKGEETKSGKFIINE